MYTALGVHVFAGGFTRGVQLHGGFDVPAQLEIHGLGEHTVRNKLDVDFLMAPHWEDWPKMQCDLLYGNPRCTGFSCVTAGLKSGSHGPWSKQTKDIHDMVGYALALNPQPRLIIFESVQQAYSVGRELMDYLTYEMLVPNGYRVAHVFLTAAAFGCCQNRRRYFFVAYKRDRNFNVSAPELPEYRTVVRDVVEQHEGRETEPFGKGEPYHDDSYKRLGSDDAAVVPHLKHGYGLNGFARYHYDLLPPKYKMIWDLRASEMPFSMHTIYRCCYDTFAPTMTSGCGKLIHPKFDRPFTIRELSSMMGLDFTPVGPDPYGQIAKGIVPAVGTWLAEQARAYLDDEWGSEDFASKFDAKTCTFEDHSDKSTPDSKVFKLTDYRTYACRRYEEWLSTIR